MTLENAVDEKLKRGNVSNAGSAEFKDEKGRN